MKLAAHILAFLFSGMVATPVGMNVSTQFNCSNIGLAWGLAVGILVALILGYLVERFFQ